MRLIPLSASDSPLAADQCGNRLVGPRPYQPADSGAGTPGPGGWAGTRGFCARMHLGLRASPAPTQVKLRAPTDHFAPFCRSEGSFFPLGTAVGTLDRAWGGKARGASIRVQ